VFPDEVTANAESLPNLRPAAGASRILGDGEMADLVRAFDWAGTSLGAIESWPENLLLTVNMILSSRHPMFLWWGEELIQFYNDAYRPSFGEGKHPSALGQRAADCWFEAWESISSRIDAVMRHGRSTWYEDYVVPIFRNGRLEDVYWTWSDSPVRDASGNVLGILVTCSESTQRIAAERELRNSEERLQLALRAAGLGMWFYDAATGLSTGDATMLRIFGSPQASGDFAYWIQFVHPDDREKVRAEFQAAIGGAAPYESEYRILRPDGELRWIRSNGRVATEPGKPLRMSVVIEDITSRKRTEEDFRGSERELAEARRIARLGTWSWERATDTTTWSDEIYAIFGRDRSYKPRTQAELRALPGVPDNWKRMLDLYERCYTHGEAYEADLEIQRPDGSRRWIVARGEPAQWKDGRVTHMRGTVQDITERKLIELQLAESGRELREAQRIGRMGSWRLVLATGELTWSEEVYTLMEHDPALPVITPAEHPEMFEEESLERLQASIDHCIATGESYEMDTRMRLPSGHLLWLATRGEAVFDHGGKVVELRGTVRDITDRKIAEEALRRSEERLRLALAAAREMGTFDWDIRPDRCIADERLCAIFGLDPELGRCGLPMAEVLANVHPDDWEQVERAARHTLDTGQDFAMDYRVRPASDTTLWVTARGNCIRGEDGTPVRFTGVILDITERKIAEETILRTEKLAAVGRLASSIAHEINNPLEAVTNLLYLAQSSESLDEARNYLSIADTELSRASAIANHTLRFHKQSTNPEAVSCQQLIDSALSLHQSRLRNAGISIERRLRSSRPFFCFHGEIRQVLGNLIGNAIDAMPASGGRLLLRSREACDWRTGTPGVRLTIADTGTGMSTVTLQRAFEAFYTTKGIAGTGLGLWISKDIVDRHRGRLILRSSQKPGRCGTVFSLFLPFEAASRSRVPQEREAVAEQLH
jgi:PAS domain S-box-containing protein